MSKHLLLIGDASDTIFLSWFCKYLKLNYKSPLSIDFISTTGNNEDIRSLSNNFDYIKANKNFLCNVKYIRIFAIVILKALEIKKYITANYDIINVHCVEPFLLLISHILRSHTKTLILSFWGEEWLKCNLFCSKKLYRMLLYKLMSMSNVNITLGSDSHEREFLKVFPEFKDKVNICSFGSASISKIKELNIRDTEKIHSKEIVGLDPRKITIAIGYCGRSEYRHLEVIRNLKESKFYIQNKELFQIVCPMTYGCGDLYRDQVEALLQESGFSYFIYRNFMDYDFLAHYRNSIDILINLPETDASSSSLIEHMLVGTICLNGLWLPYKCFRDEGFVFYDVESYDVLYKNLADCIKNFNAYKVNCQQNLNIPLEKYEWHANIQKWINLYNNSTNQCLHS